MNMFHLILALSSYIYIWRNIYINIYIYLPGKSFSFHSLSRENWLSCDLCIINPIHPNQPFSTILCNVFILTSLLFEEYILKSRIKRKYNLASINLKQNLLFHITNFISIPYSNCKINSKLYLNHILLLLTYFGDVTLLSPMYLLSLLQNLQEFSLEGILKLNML